MIRFPWALVLVLVLASACSRSVDPVTGVEEARALLARGETGEARILLKNVVSKYPEAGSARVLLAQIALDEGNAQAASDELSTLTESASSEPEAMRLRVRIEIETGKPEVALQLLQKSGEGIPQPERALLLASAYSASGASADALQVLRKVEPEVRGSEPLALGIASTLAEMGNFDLAVTELDKYLKTEPATRADAFRLRGDIKLRQGRADEAATDFEAALKSAPAAWPQISRITTELMVADAQLASGEIQSAKAQVTRIDKEWPGTFGAMILKGQIALLEGRPDEAAEHLGAAHAAGVDGDRLQYLLVEALLKSGNVVRASELLEQLVAEEPASSPARRTLAALFMQQGRPDRVIEILDADAEMGVGDDLDEVDDLLVAARLARERAAETIGKLTSRLAANPSDARLRAELAAAQLSNGEPSVALDTLGAFADGRQDPLATSTRISALYALGNSIEANRVVDQLLSTEAGNDLGVLLASADAAVKRQQTSAASRLLDRAEVLSPKSKEVRIRRASLAFTDRKFDDAEKMLRELLQQEPGNAAAQLAIARVAEAKGDTSGSRTALQAAVTAQPASIEAALMLVALELRAGDVEAASKAIDKLVEANRGASAPNAAGILLARAGRFEAARTRFRQAIDRDSETSEYWYNLGEAQLGLKDGAAAKESFLRSAKLQPDSLRAGYAAVRMSLEQKDIASARTVADTMVESLPKSPISWMLLGEVQVARNDQVAAGAAFAQSYALRPSSMAALREFSVRVASSSQRPEEPLVRWLTREPGDIAGRRMLADYYLSRGNDAGAREHLEILVKLAPNDVSTLNNLAWVLRDSAPERAESLARQVRAIAPDNPAAADTLGVILMEVGKNDEAVTVLEQAVAGMPNDPSVSYHYAKSLDKAGQKDKARGILRKVLQNQHAFAERDAAQRLFKELG